MNEKRFEFYSDENLVGVLDTVTGRTFNSFEIVDKLNEQQATIDILLEELVNAQQQGYVVNFLHKNEHCSLIPKELEDE